MNVTAAGIPQGNLVLAARPFREAKMVRTQVSLLCAALLLWSSVASGQGADQAVAAPTQRLKEQFTQMPGGSVVEVRLTNKHKLRGRLGAISDSGFELQFTKDGKIVTESLDFTNVQSVKVMGTGWSTAKKIVVGTLIGAGVLLIISVIACAAGGCNS